MPADVRFLAATPIELAAGAPARSTIQVAELGTYEDPRYGTFSITAADVTGWKQTLSTQFKGEVPIDVDHKTDKGVSSEASGWIKGLALDGDKVMADVEWTPLGESAVKEKRYRYISPTFVSNFKDQQGQGHGPALLRAALTNNPFLKSMPAVTLEGAEVEEHLKPVMAERIAGSADSPAAMPDTSKIAESLGLPADADEAKILEAITAAKTPAAPDTKTLEAQAAETGKVLLDAADLAAMKADSAKVKTLETALDLIQTERAEEKFTLAYDAALKDPKGPRVDAKPETRDMYLTLYKADADTTVKVLESLPSIVSLKAKGTGGADGDVDAPDGADPERFELHEKAEAYALEHKIDYDEAVLAIVGGNA